uniref:HTH CENPB-type domain-containing protein n=1 Tax=Amphimedon queenslandica TaxID=400682 RepID=A0A1X7UIY4_AMPQE
MASSLDSRKRKHLTLKDKFKIIKQHDKGKSVEDLKVEYGCEQTQIYLIIKQKESITNTYETNASSLSHSLGHRCRKSTFSDINDHLYLLACSKNIYLNGPTLNSKAQEIAAKLEIEGFKASNGWFDTWKHRQSIKRLCVCGEPGDVSVLTVDSWKDCLPEILANYMMEDIYNIDETGCFWHSLPNKGFGTKHYCAKEARNSKHE